MKRSLTIAFAVSAALGSGAVLAQEQAAAAKGAAATTQVAQAPAAGAVVSGGASTGAAAATTTMTFGSAVVASVPAIGISAGMAAVGAASSGNMPTTSH
jgi:hypothetical protein